MKPISNWVAPHAWAAALRDRLPHHTAGHITLMLKALWQRRRPICLMHCPPPILRHLARGSYTKLFVHAGADARELSRVVKVVLLTRLHGKLRLLTKRLRQRLGGAVAAGGDGSGGDGAAAAAAAGSSGAASDDDEDDDEEKLLLSDQLVISGVGGAGTGTDSDVGDVIGQRMRQQQAGASRGRKAGGGGAARGGLGAAGGVAKKQAAASGGKGASGKPPRPPSSRGGRAAGGGGVGSRRKYVDDSDDDDEEDKVRSGCFHHVLVGGRTLCVSLAHTLPPFWLNCDPPRNTLATAYGMLAAVVLLFVAHYCTLTLTAPLHAPTKQTR